MHLEQYDKTNRNLFIISQIVNIFPIMIVLGIISQFISPYAWIIACVLSLAYPYLLYRKSEYSMHFMLLILAYIAGAIAVIIKISLYNTTMLERPYYNLNLEGRIIEIEHYNDKKRLVIDQIQIRNHSKLDLNSIRITYNRNDKNLRVGDFIKTKANIFPVGENIIPGGFDFNRYFFFKGISAVGYTVSNIKILDRQDKYDLAMFINHIRNRIDVSAQTHLDDVNASLAASLITGNARGMPSELKENIRDIGIAHLFAISGMHMGMITMLSYIFVLWVLSRFRYVMESGFRVREFSAIIAAIIGLIYLALANFSFSAQRSYLMVLFALLALIFAKQVDVRRSIIVAMIFILLFFPESIFSPSMQMSFAACMGLAFVFSLLYDERQFLAQYWQRLKYKNRYLVYLLNMMIASLTASLFTAPYIMHHFQKLSIIGLLANSIMIPITEFLILPLCLIFTSLIPFNIEFIVAPLLNYSIDFSIILINKLAQFNHLNLGIHKVSIYSVMSISAVIYILTIFESSKKYLAILILPIIIVAECSYNYPKLMLYPDRNLQIIQINHKQYCYLGKISKLDKNSLETFLQSKLKICSKDFNYSQIEPYYDVCEQDKVCIVGVNGKVRQVKIKKDIS